MRTQKGQLRTNRGYEEALRIVYQYVKGGQFSQAVARMVDTGSGRLKGAFRCDGNHSWYVVGDCYVKLGQVGEAIRAFRKSLRGWSDDPQAMWALGNCYSEIGKPWLAEYYFRRALHLLPESVSIREGLNK